MSLVRVECPDCAHSGFVSAERLPRELHCSACGRMHLVREGVHFIIPVHDDAAGGPKKRALVPGRARKSRHKAGEARSHGTPRTNKRPGMTTFPGSSARSARRRAKHSRRRTKRLLSRRSLLFLRGLAWTCPTTYADASRCVTMKLTADNSPPHTFELPALAMTL